MVKKPADSEVLLDCDTAKPNDKTTVKLNRK